MIKKPDAEKELETVFETYKGVPSKENLEALISVAEFYKECWIEEQASDRTPRQTHPGPPTRYKRIYSVPGNQKDGTKITLALQHRLSTQEFDEYMVGWRSRLGPGDSEQSKNRRFYVSKEKPWKMDVKPALDMLEKLEAMGGLDEKYFDSRVKPDTNLFSSETLEEVTMHNEDWGEDPLLVVLKDPNPDWRKILIVNRRTDETTFRSITKSPAYKGPRKELHPGNRWYLDNSMQDVSVQLARVFLEELRSFVDSR